MQRSDFHYELPSELIAQRPTTSRSGARLLTLDGPSGRIADRQVSDLVELLQPGDLLIFNDTRVIPARLFGHKESGGRVEVLVERIVTNTSALAHIRASKAPKAGSRLRFAANVALEVKAKREEGLYEVNTVDDRTITSILEAFGHVPLPPYITRAEEGFDHERYQTIYAKHPGAVAAPTAGLHFDEPLLVALAARGVARAFVTLHVGAGTFQPVRAERLEEHQMHAEWLEVSDETCQMIAVARARGGRIVAVGTTSVRALETAAHAGRLAPYRGDTRLFITPGYQFQVVDCLLTNFHLPESTLLMLVAAFAGYESVVATYRHAVAARYRFFSYGDAMWVTAATLAPR
ncbi:MAG: tRNA preQ1(34) S-adenosylmethionine ribosyltransferase-isomerase QueA [Gammaproteobacteria bacterium]|nr:tRNA preQ1(34) S-adenosylmethionine ribosyltransferase-isomerase QueA [Gammaproteobacteria bacterium]